MRTAFLTAAALLAAATPALAARRCVTSEKRLSRPLLSRGISFGGMLQRPPSALTVGSLRGFPFLVHGPAGSMAYLEQLRDAADRAWSAEIVVAGWPAPPPDTAGPDDKYDLYVDAELDEDTAYTEPEEFDPDVRWDAMTSFIGLPASFSDDGTLLSTVAHELNHASQFALDGFEDDAFFEQTAVAVEADIVRYVIGYAVGIDDYQQNPARALDYFGEDDLYEYGSAIWLLFLGEHVGGGGTQLFLDLWRASRQTDGDGTNEPDYLDALPGVLRAKGWETDRFFATFALWRWFTGARDDGQHFRDGRAWGRGSLIGSARGAMSATPYELRASVGAFGAAVAEVELPANTTQVRVTLGGDAPAAALAALSASGQVLGDPIPVPAQPSDVSLPEGTYRLVAALTRVPTTWDPDDDDWRPRQATLTLGPTDVPLPATDAGTTDSGATDLADAGVATTADTSTRTANRTSDPTSIKEGCGCSTTRASRTTPTLLFLLALCLTRRRRG